MTMDEYIDREALERSLNERLNRLFKLHGRHDHYVQGFDDCVGRVEEFPAADVSLVRHGRWEARAIPRSDPDGDWIALEYHCSLCNRLEYRKENYCPNCGAKMDGVDNE